MHRDWWAATATRSAVECRVITIPVRDNNWYSNWMRKKPQSGPADKCHSQFKSNKYLSIKIDNWIGLVACFRWIQFGSIVTLSAFVDRVSSQMLVQYKGRRNFIFGNWKEEPNSSVKDSNWNSQHILHILYLNFCFHFHFHHPVWWERCVRDRNEMMMTPTKRNTEFNLILYSFFPYCMMYAAASAGWQWRQIKTLFQQRVEQDAMFPPLAMSLRCFEFF